jgi:hypothetical protein
MHIRGISADPVSLFQFVIARNKCDKKFILVSLIKIHAHIPVFIEVGK